MDKIKITDILEKHLGKFPGETFSDRFRAFYMTHDPQVAERRLKWAIKEIVELVIDKCVEEANSKDVTSPNCHDHTPYWGACVTCGRTDNPDIITGSEVDKQSILQVKQMIDYE